MVPNFMNSSAPAPASFPVEDQDDPLLLDRRHLHHQLFLPSTYATAAASSSSVSYSVFFDSSQDIQPQHCTFHHMHHDPPIQLEDATNHGHGQLKISLWKNSDENNVDHQEMTPVNWMPSKVRLMQKMKKPHVEAKPEQPPVTSSPETDHFSSSNSSSNNSNTSTTPPFRVCADCNTTKTPLWRSGPKGPKSLCNACGIRQRKARRAMAAAAAANGGTSPQNETTKSSSATSLKIKVQNKEKIVKNNGHTTTQFKKRSKVITTTAAAAAGPSQQQKNNVFEEFLFNLSKNLAFHRVFPQDEKEAAILLMALSSGLVHG